MKLVPVDPASIPNFKESHRGRVSYPILKTFLEQNVPVSKLDRTGMQQSFQSLYSCLNSYIKNHGLPVKLFQRMGEIYLARLDIDEDGNFIEDWASKANPENQGQPVTSIDSDEVARRFQEEKDKVTK